MEGVKILNSWDITKYTEVNWVAVISLYFSSPTKTTYYNVCIIDENVSMDEFTDYYNIIETNGEIYTVTIKGDL
jgi:hypothetical protein